MNAASTSTSTAEQDTSTGPNAVLARAMAVRQYVVRHRCGQPVGVYRTRDLAAAAADKVPAPARFQLRIAVAAEADMIATLRQRHCTHIPR